MHFDEIEQIFSEAKVQFAVSAVPSDSVDMINYTPDQLKILNAIEDRSLKQTVGDFIKNQQFRRDYYVKGLRFLDPTEQQRRLLELKVLLRSDSENFVYKTSSLLGEVGLKEEIYRPIVQFLGDGRVHPLGEIAQTCPQLPLGSIVSAVQMLSGKGDLVAAQEPDEEIVRNCRALNNEILKYAEGRGELTFLSSPVSGSGVFLSVLEQIMLKAVLAGAPQDQGSLQQCLKDNLIRRKAGLNVKGRAVAPDSEEGQAEIAGIAGSFAGRIKQLKALQII